MRRDSPASGRCPQFTEDHQAFRELARDFIGKEVVPAYPEWEKGGRMPRDVFKQMGALGIRRRNRSEKVRLRPLSHSP